MEIGDSVLSRWDPECANAAVPLSRSIIERIEAAEVAVGVQRRLARLGYEVGPLGFIDGSLATEAIRQAERDMGWAPTGIPTYALLKILELQTGRPAGSTRQL